MPVRRTSEQASALTAVLPRAGTPPPQRLRHQLRRRCGGSPTPDAGSCGVPSGNSGRVSSTDGVHQATPGGSRRRRRDAGNRQGDCPSSPCRRGVALMVAAARVSQEMPWLRASWTTTQRQPWWWLSGLVADSTCGPSYTTQSPTTGGRRRLAWRTGPRCPWRSNTTVPNALRCYRPSFHHRVAAAISTTQA